MHFTSSFTLTQTATKRHPTPEQYGPFVTNLVVTKRQAGILEKKQPGRAWRLHTKLQKKGDVSLASHNNASLGHNFSYYELTDSVFARVLDGTTHGSPADQLRMAPAISRTRATSAGCGTVVGSTNTAAFLLAASAFARASSACSPASAVPDSLPGFAAREAQGGRTTRSATIVQKQGKGSAWIKGCHNRDVDTKPHPLHACARVCRNKIL